MTWHAPSIPCKRGAGRYRGSSMPARRGAFETILTYGSPIVPTEIDPPIVSVQLKSVLGRKNVCELWKAVKLTTAIVA